MNPVEKLALLRAEMAKRHIDAYVVVTDDFHTSEYVGAHFKARESLSGFTGSAGTLVVLPDAAALDKWLSQSRQANHRVPCPAPH